MNSLMIKASPEKLTEIYFLEYLHHRHNIDMPYAYTAEDFVNFTTNNPVIKHTMKFLALQLYNSHREKPLLNLFYMLYITKEINISEIGGNIFFIEPYSCIVDMSGPYDLKLLKQKELEFIDEITVVSEKDKKDLLIVRESIASTIAKIEQKEIEQVMNEKPVTIKKKARL